MKNLTTRYFGIAVAVVLAAMVPAVPAAQKTGSSAKKPPATTTTATKPAAKPGISKNPYLGAIVIDASTGKVLGEDQADAVGYPASVLKLMDLLIIMEKIDQRQLSLQDSVTISAKASKTGGSQVWLADKEVFTVDELLYALMVQSANDAAVALSEKVAGTSEAFVELMNKRAQELGMSHTRFHSVHGLPPGAGQEPDVTTARDFSALCRELLKHSDVLRYSSTRERPFRPQGGDRMVVMRTHNHLMAQFEGCDGFKTGYYAVAGYSIAATATRKGQRVVAVVLGSSDRKVRDAKAAEWMAKGFNALPAIATAPGPVTPPATTAPTTAKPQPVTKPAK
jgi:serine-type D-Ala-D-Ala carboxypeptidase (penicillin-binding protein 5/6)